MSKIQLTCPHCGIVTSFAPIMIEDKGIIVNRCEEDIVVWDDVKVRAIGPEEHGFQYAIVECISCGENFVAAKEGYAEEWRGVYPILRIAVTEDVPEPIRSMYKEASICFAVGAYMACVSMCMAAMEATWRDKKVSGLNELKERGDISPHQFDRATEIRLWARLVKHEPIEEFIEKDDAKDLLSYLGDVLDTVYVQGAKYQRLKEKRVNREKQIKDK